LFLFVCLSPGLVCVLWDAGCKGVFKLGASFVSCGMRVVRGYLSPGLVCVCLVGWIRVRGCYFWREVFICVLCDEQGVIRGSLCRKSSLDVSVSRD